MQKTQTLSSKKLALICTAGLVAGGLLYYFVRRRSASRAPHFPRELILKVATKLRRSYYPFLQGLWNSFDKSVAEEEKASGSVSESFLQSLPNVLVKSGKFTRSIERMESRVFNKFSVKDHAHFKQVLQALSQTDNEVKIIVDDINQRLFKAARGQRVIEDFALPDHVTPDLVLEIQKKTHYAGLTQLNNFLASHVTEENAPSFTAPEMARMLESVRNTCSVKDELLCVNGLDFSAKYHQEHVFACAVEKFSREDSDFKKRLMSINKTHAELVEAHLQPDQDYASLREDFGILMAI